MRALAALALLAASAALAPLAGALQDPALLVAGPGFGSSTDGSCHGALAAHLSFFPGGEAVAGVDFFGADAADCGFLLNGGGMHALGVVHYDLAGPAVGYEFPCNGAPDEGLSCGGVTFGPYRGPGTWMWVRAHSFEGWFFAV